MFRSGEALERLAEIAAIRFDKTGTLTTRSAVVSQFVGEPTDAYQTSLARAATLAAVSTHPMSLAIVELAASRQLPLCPEISEIKVVSGSGVVGTLEPSDRQIVLGSRRFAEERGLAIAPAIEATVRAAESRGLPLSLVGWGTQVRGVFVFEEHWRDRAAEVLMWLAREGLDVTVLTGDGARPRARSCAASGREGGSRAPTRSKGPGDRAREKDDRTRVHGGRRSQ